MAILDPTTDIGKMRLRCGDFSDIPIMPDSVYTSALADCDGYLPRACVLVCQYILAALTGQTRQSLAQVEVFGAEWFQNYLAFVKATILNPHLMLTLPIPYASTFTDIRGQSIDKLPMQEFQEDWNKSYSGWTETEQTHAFADFNAPLSSPYYF